MHQWSNNNQRTDRTLFLVNDAIAVSLTLSPDKAPLRTHLLLLKRSRVLRIRPRVARLSGSRSPVDPCYGRPLIYIGL